MLEGTRRDFLRLTLASLATCSSSLLWAGSESGVRAWVTSKSRRFEEIEAPRWRISSSNFLTGIHVDPGQHKQEILGFGAALTDASCYLRSGQLAPVCGGPFALSGSRWSAILYRPPYGLTGWGELHTGHGVVLRALTLHLPTNLPPPLHSEVIM
jgi:hypothetical protein